MISNFKNVLKNWKNFSGRATRYEFWMFYLAYYIMYFVAAMICVAIACLGVVLCEAMNTSEAVTLILVMPICLILLATMIVTLVPYISLTVRRLHDINKSGWWYLICSALSLCCGIGAIIFIVFLCMDGTVGPNNYGPDPKGRLPMNQMNGQFNNNQQLF